jgi:hypothetical protein
MPETSMDENHLAVTRQHDIGVSGQATHMEPISKAHGMHNPTHRQLRLRIRLPDPRHAF